MLKNLLGIWAFCAAAVWTLGTLQPALAQEQKSAPPVSFKADIAPILAKNCTSCHGTKRAEAGLRMDTFAQLLRGAPGDAKTIVAGKPDASEIVARVLATEAERRMPPKGLPLTSEQIELIKRWVAAGAKYDGTAPSAPLATIIPIEEYPASPEAYQRPTALTAMAVSADGKLLYAPGKNEISVWNTATGKLHQRIGQAPETIFGIDLSPDGKQLLVTGGSLQGVGASILYDAASGQPLWQVAADSGMLWAGKFSPSGKQVAVAIRGAIVVVDLEHPDRQQPFPVFPEDTITTLAWSPDGAHIACGTRGTKIRVFTPADGSLLAQFDEHKLPIMSVGFSPDSKSLASNGRGGSVYVWPLSEPDNFKTLEESKSYSALATGAGIAALGIDKTVRRYNWQDLQPQQALSGHAGYVLSAAWHAESNRLATGGLDGQVFVWDAAGTQAKPVLKFYAAPGYRPAAE